MRQGGFVALHDDVEVVFIGCHVAGCVQLAEFFFQLLRFVGSHDTCVVHQLGGIAQFREFAFTGSVLYNQLEYVVLLVGRGVHLGTVVQLLDLHFAVVCEFLFHLSDGQGLELRCIKRFLAYRRFYGFVPRLLNLGVFVRFPFFDI